MTTTTIQVDEETADRLHARKRRGDTYDDVVRRLLDAADQEHAAIPTAGQEHEGGRGSIERLDLPGSGETLEQRREAIGRLYDHLRKEGAATRSDFLELVDADRVGYSSPESFWSNCVKGRESLKSLPGVVSPGEGEHQWRFLGREGDRPSNGEND